MKNAIWLFKHITAIAVTLFAIWVITLITLKLYFYPGQSLNIVAIIQALWKTNNIYFQFLVIMNFIVKPIFVYYLTLVILDCYGRLRR